MKRALALAVALLLTTAVPAAAHHDLPENRQFRQPPPYLVADTPLVDVHAAVAPWNEMAGREVFVVSERTPGEYRVPDVTWTDASGENDHGFEPRRPYVLPPYWGGVPTCRITVAPGHLAGAQHELGHCAGFADHVHTDQQGLYHPSSWYCADVDKPWMRWSTYSGVMSYCSWDGQVDWFGAGDRAMMDRRLTEWDDPIRTLRRQRFSGETR